MALRAVQHYFTGTTTPYTAYDSTLTNLGQWIQQKTGMAATAKWAGPAPLAIARPMEQSTAIQTAYPHVIDQGNGTHWVFLAENSAAAPTRRIVLYTYNTATNAFSWRGFITLTYPPNTNHTIRALRVVRHTYSTGTVAVSGTAVTGTSTAWQTARYAVGSRIGFGSTNPNNITTWYYITAMASDTGITIGTTAGTISAGTPYVIDELRVYTATTNATATNGGLFVAKGVNFDDFITSGTTIAAATTTDNLKAVYWLADASTVLNTAAGGMGLGPTVTDTSHELYVTNADAATSLRIYKYDVRVALAGLAAGKSVSAFVHRTGAQTVTGTISQTNSGRIGTLNHGPGSGVSSLYLATASRILRCAESGITNGSTTFVTDQMVEIPPGTVNTFAATAAFTSVEIAGSIDRLVVCTGSGQRHYVTRYNSVSDPLDRVCLADNKQLDSTLADVVNAPSFPSNVGFGFSAWVEAGMAYLLRLGTAAANNIMYAVPFGADWDFAAGTSAAFQNRLISPKLATPGAVKYGRMAVQNMHMAGGNSLGLQVEPYRTYYRTAGIDDDSGGWTLLDDSGDMSGVGGAANIQFMFEFRVIGPFCLTNRIYGLICTYEDTGTDSHYQPSVANSNVTTKRFAWRFATAFGGTVPTLTINLYDAVTGVLQLTDTTATSASGTFEKSTNGGSSWGAYNTTDKANDTTYIRYTPTSLADNIRVRAVLTQ
jgi:hypothetical protein